jgi:hypothetical protein
MKRHRGKLATITRFLRSALCTVVPARIARDWGSPWGMADGTVAPLPVIFAVEKSMFVLGITSLNTVARKGEGTLSQARVAPLRERAGARRNYAQYFRHLI